MLLLLVIVVVIVAVALVYKKCVIFKCYSSEKHIVLNTLHEVSPPGTHFTAESTEAMRIKCSRGSNRRPLYP